MKVNLLFIIILCMAIISGCLHSSYQYTRTTRILDARAYHLPIYIDKNFSSEDRITIDDVINQWNYVLNGHVIIYAETYEFDMEPESITKALNQGLLILKINSKSTFLPGDDAPNHRILAWVDSIGGHKMWVVRDRIYSQSKLQNTMLHELGHILGVDHINVDDSIMAEADPGMPCIDKLSAYAAAKYWRLLSTQVNYCNLNN